MCEKMEELVIKPRPLDMTGEWVEQVNGRADRIKEDRQKQNSWEEQQKALARTRKRANHILCGLLFGFSLIVAGGWCLNHVAVVPAWIAISISIAGVAAYFLTLGWVIGYRCRR